MTGSVAEKVELDGVNEEDAQEYLTFHLNSQEYGVEILKVQGIQGWAPVTTIPNTPDYILGVLNLRGSIVPVVDLRKRFSMPDATFNEVTVVIVVKIEHAGDEKTVGLVVDAVSEVRRIGERDLSAAPSFGSGVDTDFVRGLASIEEKMVILLDVDELVGEGILEQAESA